MCPLNNLTATHANLPHCSPVIKVENIEVDNNALEQALKQIIDPPSYSSDVFLLF